jgi:hypothetical protein
LFDQPAEWQKAVDTSAEWARKTMAVLNHGHHTEAPKPEAAPAEKKAPAPKAAAKAASKKKTPKGHKPKAKK